MKGTILLVVLGALVATTAASGRSRLSPITRVVELLKGLAKQIETDHEKEEDLYETYVCWGKTVVDTKTATNAAAESRIEELTNYIADIDAGRIEFTSERVDLEKDIKDLSDSIEEATRLREKAHNDFLEAEDEMDKAITALDKAIAVLGEATAGHETGVFLAVDARQGETLGLGEGFSERAEDAAALHRAVQLGGKFLSKGDTMFLQRLLTGEVPDVDWKKLNRKANFKKSYKARSFKIQDVLQKMQGTFTDNLKDARAKEADDQKTYDDLMTAKKEQLGKAQEALQNMESENGARGLTKEESQAEVDALTEQVANDKKFIEQTNTELAEKKVEWKDRQELRSGELAAVQKAIKILYSDDSRDLFKKSLASQSMFLQEGMTTSSRGQAMAVLQQLERLAGDRRLEAISTLASMSRGHFDEVIVAIDKMIATLKSEEADDLAVKETCEQNRMDNTRDAILESRDIDEMTDKITKLQEEIADLKRQIEENVAQIAQIKEQLEQARRTRTDENTEWIQSDKEDGQAAALVLSARDVLSSFYTESGLMLVQKAKVVPVEAGKAPPPPPTTWEAPYGGKTGESTSIISCLDMIHEDIIADQTKADAAEKAAQKSFEEFETLSDKQSFDLAEACTNMDATIADDETEIEETKTQRGTAKDTLDAAIKTIKDNEPGCNYATINYSVRRGNRHIEIDGLVKAKAILQGAVFDKGPDPNREMKVGDAFLQRRK